MWKTVACLLETFKIGLKKNAPKREKKHFLWALIEASDDDINQITLTCVALKIYNVEFIRGTKNCGWNWKEFFKWISGFAVKFEIKKLRDIIRELKSYQFQIFVEEQFYYLSEKSYGTFKVNFSYHMVR